MKTNQYLMASLIQNARDTKEKKKAVRKENIEKGSKYQILIYIGYGSSLILLPVEKFEKGCKEFAEDMFSGTFAISTRQSSTNTDPPSPRRLSHLPRQYHLPLRPNPRPHQSPHQQKRPLRPQGVPPPHPPSQTPPTPQPQP